MPLATYQASPEKYTFSFFLFYNGAHYFLEELKLEFISQLFFLVGGRVSCCRAVWTGYRVIAGDELIQ
jgi:hypothetical protein